MWYSVFQRESHDAVRDSLTNFICFLHSTPPMTFQSTGRTPYHNTGDIEYRMVQILNISDIPGKWEDPATPSKWYMHIVF